MALAAIADVWFVVLWSRRAPGEEVWADPALIDSATWLVLLGSAAMALGIWLSGSCFSTPPRSKAAFGMP